jgi:hypothetical protein
VPGGGFGFFAGFFAGAAAAGSAGCWATAGIANAVAISNDKTIRHCLLIRIDPRERPCAIDSKSFLHNPIRRSASCGRPGLPNSSVPPPPAGDRKV